MNTSDRRSTIETAFRFISIAMRSHNHLRQIEKSITHEVCFAFILLGELAEMSIAKEDKVKFGDMVFVNRKLTDDEKIKFQAWYGELGDTIFDVIGTLCFDTWKCSLSWDNDNDCYIHTATQIDAKHKNAGIAITSRSDVWIEAMCMTAYKINVLYANKKIPKENMKENWG